MKDLQDIVRNSPKLRWVEENVIKRLKPDEKLVIITNFCLVADVINQWINRRKLKKGERKLTSALFYFGLTFTQRNQLIDGFQDYLDIKKSDGSYKEAFRPDVLVANTRVIAYGHNLTRANKMVIMEPDYSAQVEAQECAREHRLGQWRPVRVYRMACKDVPQEKATLDQQKMTMGFTSDMYKVNVGDQGEIIEISSGDESDVAA